MISRKQKRWNIITCPFPSPQDHALSDEECEDVLRSPTRQQRAWRLLYHLRHRDPHRKPFTTFVKALQKDHNFLAELLKETNQALRDDINGLKSNEHDEFKNRNMDSGILCSNCQNSRKVGECQNVERFNSDRRELDKGLDKESQDVTLDALFCGLQAVLLDGTRERQRTIVLQQNCDADSNYRSELFPCSQFDNFSRFSFDLNPSKQAEDNDIESNSDTFMFSMHFGEFVERRLGCLTNSEDSEYIEESSSIEDGEIHEENELLVRYVSRVKEMPSANGGKQYKNQTLTLAFDKLSTLINSGGFDPYKRHRDCLIKGRPEDADLVCMLYYLDACIQLFKGNLMQCENIVNEAIKLMPRTSSPSRVMVELFSLRCWMFLKENKLNALEYDLQDAAQIIAQDPLGCAGKAAGWLYFDEARRLIPLMSTNNQARSYAIKDKAIKCLEKALEQFHYETGKDGPYGFNYVTIKLASLKLACGELMQTTDLQPTVEELVDATERLRLVEACSIGNPAVLKAQNCMAMSDLHYRRHNLARALNYAEEGYNLAHGLGCPEETRCAQVRQQFYRNLYEQSFSCCVLRSQGHESVMTTTRDPVKLKYMRACSGDSDQSQECGLKRRTGRMDMPAQVLDKNKLRFFVRVWFLIALLSSCWMYSGM